MARKPNIQQTRSWRNGCLITIALLAAVLVFLKPAFGAGPKAYVGNFKDNTISVIDLELKRVTATIPIPPGPHGMVITPDNRWLYVASDGASTVSLIDTERASEPGSRRTSSAAASRSASRTAAE